MRLVPCPNRDGLAVGDITIADALKGASYATGHFGKWHLYTKMVKVVVVPYLVNKALM